MTEYKINTKYLGFFETTKNFPKKPSAIVIHHTCTKNAEKTRKELKKKKYSTHFEVEKDGTIYQYMDVEYMASHCGSFNSHAIGIDFTHMKDAEWPREQVLAGYWLVTYLCHLLDIPQTVVMEIKGIIPHCALGSTVCPNGFPMEELNSNDS